MFGNILGWKISSAILAAAVLLAVWIQIQLQITAPTALLLDPKNLLPLAEPLPAEPIVDQSHAGDAGVQYRSALAGFDDSADARDKFTSDPQTPVPGPLQSLLDAAHLSDMNLFAQNPGEVINYQSENDSLQNLNTLGHELATSALLFNKRKDNQSAQTYFEAEYSLGFKLYRERVVYEEYLNGMGLMDEALQGLADLQPIDSPKRKVYLDHMASLMAYNSDRITPVYTVLVSADPNVIAANAGDVFRFADQAGEHMFRVEAILKLGRYRYDSGRTADQLAAPRYLCKFAAESDPSIQTAAQAGLGLSIEQYRMIH